MTALNHITLTCCHKACYAVITLHPDDEQRLRRTHESFYCPAGHSQHFTGKTEEEKRLGRAERDAERWERTCRNWIDRCNDAHDIAELLAAGVRTCPLGCGWTTSRRVRIRGRDAAVARRYLDRAGHDLTDHLVREHNATRRPVALLPAGDTEEAA